MQCSEKELDSLIENTRNLLHEDSGYYDTLLKILQQGHNIREATLSAIIIGEILGYKKAEFDMEEEIKDKLFRAFKNNQ